MTQKSEISGTTDVVKEIKEKVEAVLFAVGRKIDLEEISKITHVEDKTKIEEALKELQQDYSKREGSISLVQQGTYWKMGVADAHIPTVQDIISETELDKQTMETLAVIAYKAPVLQSEVIKIRTNKAYDHLKLLEEMGYITREVSGRTRLIKLSQYFFKYFDVPSDNMKNMFNDVKEAEEAVEQKEEELKEIKEQVKELEKQKKKEQKEEKKEEKTQEEAVAEVENELMEEGIIQEIEKEEEKKEAYELELEEQDKIEKEKQKLKKEKEKRKQEREAKRAEKEAAQPDSGELGEEEKGDKTEVEESKEVKDAQEKSEHPSK